MTKLLVAFLISASVLKYDLYLTARGGERGAGSTQNHRTNIKISPIRRTPQIILLLTIYECSQ